MKYKVLLLEDKHSNLDNLIKELMQRGYEVVEYQDSVDKMSNSDLNLASSDYLIMDITKPFINGINFIEKIQNRDVKIKNIAIFAGFISEEDIEKAVSLGCRIFPRPPSIVSLLDWLEKRKGLDPPQKELEKY